MIVPPSHPEAIANALRRITSGETTAGFAPRNIEQYTYPRPATAMAQAIEQAIEARLGGEERRRRRPG